MTNNDELSLNQVCGLLRAMASNYTAGHCWDHLDGEAVSRAANGIESLLAERDWQAKRIEMLEKYVKERDDENQGLLLTVGRLHTNLEARTVSIKLPPASLAELNDSVEPVWTTRSVIAACADAGIKLEVEE